MKTIIILFLISTDVLSIELRDKIVIIDSGISLEESHQSYMCNNGVLSTVNDNGIDENGHGTNIVSIIAPNIKIKKQCLISIKVIKRTMNASSGEFEIEENFSEGLKKAVNINPKFLNISMSGPTYVEKEFVYLKNMLKNGTIISVAAGNEHKDLSKDCFAFPACYRVFVSTQLQSNFYVVGSETTDGNFGYPVNVYLDGKEKGVPVRSGTSQATATMTSILISK
jgi:subtilisin family serine protease